jgi:DivIVA domain-containing protein
VKGESKELMELWGVALLEPGQSITVVENPGASWLVVPVYARENLAGLFRLYPRMLDDKEMWEYQLTMPLTWMAGGIFGAAMVALLAFHNWLWNRPPWVRLTASEPADSQSRGSTADERTIQGTGRKMRLGVISLGFAAVVGFLVAFNAGSANPWGMTAAAVGIVTLTASGINYLMRRPNPVVTKATNLGFLIGCLIVVGWTQARPDDLVGTRMPTAASVRITGLVLGALVLAAAGWSVLRRLRARTLGQPGPMPSTGRATFTVTKRGYDTADVDYLLAGVAALPDTPEGRHQGRTRIEATRFHLSRGSGYAPRQVDQYLDQLIEEYAEASEHPHPESLPEAPSGTH